MAAPTTNSLPESMQALVCPAKGQPLAVQTIPTPQPGPGSIVIKVIAASVDPALPEVLSGGGWFSFPEPFVPGSRTIGRVAALGIDTTSFSEGQLVFIDPFLVARDNPNIQALFGFLDGTTPTGKTWFANNWRNAGYAEYVSAPLENVYPLNEDILCNQLNYKISELVYLPQQLVAYGGLSGIKLQAGERIVIAPATGGYSGAAISVALAMGAIVVAAGRSMAKLKEVQKHFPAGRVYPVELSGDVEKDSESLQAFGPVDAYLDLSPPQAQQSTHVRSCFNAVRPYGRVGLMGVLNADIAIPYISAVFKNLTIKGQYMYERNEVRSLIKMVESGVLKVGKDIGCYVTGEFKLEDVDKAFKHATENSGYGQLTVFTPHT